jgi:hypothetical protein
VPSQCGWLSSARLSPVGACARLWVRFPDGGALTNPSIVEVRKRLAAAA